MAKYLDSTGLTYLWAKIKAWVGTYVSLSNGTITIGSNSITPLTDHQDISGKADVATTLAGYGITDAKIDGGVITLGSNTITPLTSHQDISGKVNTSAIGAANGVCPLNASSKIDSTYLPSYVDDVVEVYARTGQTALTSTWFSTTSASGSALTPETGKIYVLMADSGDYAANTQFRWGGSAYVKLADGGVSAITTTEIDAIVAN